jgi:hypothetical protein
MLSSLFTLLPGFLSPYLHRNPVGIVDNMFISKSFYILLLPVLLEARALKRDVCDWVNAEPVLYQEYYGDSCPPANELLPNGACSISTSTRPPCAKFCQNRTTFRFGQEQPYPGNRGYCHGPLTCTITDTTTTTWSGLFSAPVSAKSADAFSLRVCAALRLHLLDSHASRLHLLTEISGHWRYLRLKCSGHRGRLVQLHRRTFPSPRGILSP